MFIQSIKVKNFGPLRELDIGLRSCGINLISGANATGKTQLLGALIASLVGRKALSLSKSAEDESSIEVILSEPPDFERIELTTSTRPNGQVYIQHHISGPNENQCNGQLFQRLSEALTPGRKPSLIMDGTMPSNHFTRAVLYAIEGTDVFRSLPLYMQEELRRLAEHDYPIGSWNLQVFTSLLSEYASRRWDSNKIPLLVDDPFAALDYVSIEPLWQILLAIAEDQQVIVLTSITDLPVDPIVVLGISPSLPNSKANYNYRSHKRSLVSKKYAQPKFIYGNSFPYDENRYLELKEVRGSNPSKSIESVVDQYVVAYLNSQSAKPGRIIWGIRDSDRTIIGVNLSSSDRDHVRRLITEKLHAITPTLAPSSYTVELHKVHSFDKSNENLYIVEVNVPPSKEHMLYATGKQEVFIKTDSGKRKLTALELQKELLQRITRVLH